MVGHYGKDTDVSIYGLVEVSHAFKVACYPELDLSPSLSLPLPTSYGQSVTRTSHYEPLHKRCSGDIVRVPSSMKAFIERIH